MIETIFYGVIIAVIAGIAMNILNKFKRQILGFFVVFFLRLIEVFIIMFCPKLVLKKIDSTSLNFLLSSANLKLQTYNKRDVSSSYF